MAIRMGLTTAITDAPDMEVVADAEDGASTPTGNTVRTSSFWTCECRE